MATNFQPRASKGTKTGGQWVATDRPDDVKTQNIQLDDDSTSHAPIKKLTIKMMARQRTIQYIDGRWRTRTIWSSPIAKHMGAGGGPSLLYTLDGAIELASLVVVDMLNEGDLKEVPACEYQLASYQKYLNLIGQSAIRGAYTYKSPDHRQDGDQRELYQAIQGRLQIESAESFEIAMARLKGMELGCQWRGVSLQNDSEYSDWVRTQNVKGIADTVRNLHHNIAYARRGKDDLLPTKILTYLLPRARETVADSLSPSYEYIRKYYSGGFGFHLPGMINLAMAGLGSATLDDLEKQHLLRTLETIVELYGDTSAVNDSFEWKVGTISDPFHLNYLESHREEMRRATHYIHQNSDRTKHKNLRRHLAKILRRAAKKTNPDAPRKTAKEALSTLEVARERQREAHDRYTASLS